MIRTLEYGNALLKKEVNLGMNLILDKTIEKKDEGEELFEPGKRVILEGSSKEMRHVMHYLPTRFYGEGKRTLVFDTLNSINPHHPFFNDVHQEGYFKEIFCVRTPLPYDLWARLATSGEYIRKKHIEVLLVTSLSLFFKEAQLREVEALLKNILKRIDQLTKTYGLITILGTSFSEDKAAKLAYTLLTGESGVRPLHTEEEI